MAPQESKQPCTRDDALAVLRRLREAGQTAYFAGGCVRDLLLGIEPKDFDVATDAPPSRVRELFFNTQAVGAAFGVILVHHGGSVVEVATFRSDGKYLDGRHPSEVRFTTAEEDARRRDFTVNGLFLDPLNGQVIDYVGGQADLQGRRIRAIGEPAARFDEDSLRLLRAVRFSARFDFAIEPATAAAIRTHAAQLRRISPERVADELRMILAAPTRAAAWRLLWELRLIHEIYRFLHTDVREPRDPSLFLFPRIAPGERLDFGLALAAATLCYRFQTRPMVRDVRAFLSRLEVTAAVHALRQSLKISNDESEAMRQTLTSLEPLLADKPPTVAIMKRFLASPTAASARALMDALQGIVLGPERISSLRDELARLEQTDYAPTPLLDGNDLAALGLQPGPFFKRILESVYDAQLEGRAATKEQASQLAMEIAQASG